MTCIYGACNGRNCLDCGEAEESPHWEDLSQEVRDAILRVGTGELTADEAAEELRTE